MIPLMEIKLASFRDIPGLYIHREFLPEGVQGELLAWIDTQAWSSTLSRRTQHYGYEYVYASKSLGPAQPIPPELDVYASCLSVLMGKKPDQIIVNEYTRDQHIAAHTDHRRWFGPSVVSISLGAPTDFILTRGERKQTICLLPGDLLLMRGDARDEWKHEVPHSLYYHRKGATCVKPIDYRRVSVTFRTVA
jgi:alkylated DNA repair dioxygenase AlkB